MHDVCPDHRSVALFVNHNTAWHGMASHRMAPQGGGAAGPAGGDAKAVELVAEMEKGDWGKGCLTENDRIGMFMFVDAALHPLAGTNSVLQCSIPPC